MKTTITFGILLATAVFPALAQDSKPAQAHIKAEAEAAAKEAKKPAVVPPKPESPALKKRVVYGGYLTDLKRAETKRALFNLKAPIDPVKDFENLWFDPASTNKVQGTVLFSIKF